VRYPRVLSPRFSRGSAIPGATGIKSCLRGRGRLFAVAEFRRRELKSITMTLIGRERELRKGETHPNVFREAEERGKRMLRYAGAAFPPLEAI